MDSYDQMQDYEDRYEYQRRGRGQQKKKKLIADKVQDHFKDPFKQTILPIFDKLIDNPKQRMPMEDMYDYPQMMSHRSMRRDMMMMRGGMGMGMHHMQQMMMMNMNQMERKLFSLRTENYQSLKESILQSTLSEIKSFNNKFNKTMQLLKQRLFPNLKPGTVDIEKFKQVIVQKIKQISTEKEFNQQANRLQSIIFQAKKFKKENAQKLKNRTPEELQAAKNLSLELLNAISVNGFCDPYKKLQKKIRSQLSQARYRQEFKVTKIKQLKYKQQSPYYKKIMMAVAKSGMDQKQENIQGDFKMDTYFTQGIDRRTLSTLNPNAWLDNRVITNVLDYFKMIEGANDMDGERDVIILNHSQSDALSKHPLQGLKHLSFKDFRKIVLLINETNKHWYVVSVFRQNEKKRHVWVYDSMLYSTNHHSRSYIDAIIKRIRDQTQLNVEFQQRSSPNNTIAQKNLSDCGVCSIIAVIKTVDSKSLCGQQIRYDYDIIDHLRYSLYLMLGYFAGCKRQRRMIRRDYFSFLIRNTIYHNLQSSLYNQFVADRKKNQKQRTERQNREKQMKQRMQNMMNMRNLMPLQYEYELE